MINLYDLSLAELTDVCAGLGERPFRARQLYAWLYGKGVNSLDAMTDISEASREKIKTIAKADGLSLTEDMSSADGQTTKYLYELEEGGSYIETVFMKYKDRNSICISTQAGCRMGCNFCASGADGLLRNLSPAEMALQVILSERAADARTKNIVLMGVGEPLDNYENVKKFIENITDDHGRDLSRRAITLSTCGLVPGIERMAKELPQVNLAVSLHAPNDELRKKIMPVTKKYGVAEVVAATQKHYEKTRRRSTFEYALIEGFNDSLEHAKELAALLKGMNCLVNLIPLNSINAAAGTESSLDLLGSLLNKSPRISRLPAGEHMSADKTGRTLCLAAESFREELGRRHVPATVRKSLGEDIEAACGQLRLRKTDKKGMRM